MDSMNFDFRRKIHEIKVLKNKPREDEARKILERVVNEVRPLMTKRQWRVDLLSEFWPDDPGTLGRNVDGGQEVNLRLRKEDGDFLPYKEILDTMLHELCHNVYACHNTAFYELWNDLRKECPEMMIKSVTSTGQSSQSREIIEISDED